MLIGEAPCTEDLITITNTDFNTVNAVSIILIFIIIAFVLKSVSLRSSLLWSLSLRSSSTWVSRIIPNGSSVYRFHRNRNDPARCNR